MAALAMNGDDNVWIAASDGDIPKVQAYLAQDPSLATKGDHNGYTCMHAAAGKKLSYVVLGRKLRKANTVVQCAQGIVLYLHIYAL